MDELLIIIFELSINLFESYLMIDFITKFNGNKYEDKKHIIFYISAVSLLFADISIANYLSIPVEIPSYIAIIIMIIYSVVALNGNLILKISSCILFNIVLILVNGSSIFIFGIIFNVSVDMMMYTFGFYRFVLLISSKIILFYLSKIILNFKHIKYKKIPKSSWVLVTVIPFLTIFIMVTITESATYNIDIRATFYLLLSIFGLIIANIVFYHTFMISVRDYEISIENQLLKQNIELQKKHSIELKGLYQQIQTMRHDMKNHLISIRTLVEDENYNKVLNHINSMMEEIEMTKKFVFTNNEMFNAIINNKFSVANTKSIKTTVNIYCDIADQIEDADINILFGNLLDNAIESCEKIEGYKEINLLIEKKRNYLSIRIKNSIANAVLKDNPKLQTSKDDRDNHGMGIRSIKKIIQKYDGIIDFTEEGNFFICDILILSENSKNEYQVYS